MPLVLAATLAWIAATAAGLSVASWGVATLVAAALAAAAFVVWWRGAPTTFAPLAMVAATGIAFGADLRRADRRCLDDAVHATAWTVRLDARAEPGSFARGALVRRDCQVRVAVATRQGEAEAGSRVRITRAEVSGSDSELLLREAVLKVEAPAGPLARWRTRVAKKLDDRFGTDGPVVRALLIADTRGLDPGLRERYADAGLVHLLSISGLHVAIVGGALLLLFHAARLPDRSAAVAAVAVTAAYVLAIGAPAPAVRSATLFLATTLSRLAQRPTSPWGSFALGAVVPLIEPRTVLDLGWQLSVTGYAAVVVAARVGRRLPESWQGVRGAVAREIVAGCLATITTAPLVAWHFGRLSLIAPLSNIAATPVISLLQPALFLVMVLPGALGGAFVADAARPLLRAMDGVAAGAAAVPGGSLTVAPSLVAAVLAATMVVGLLVAGWSRRWERPLILALGAVAMLAWLPAGAILSVGDAELHLIDVGQGDAIAIRSPRGRWVVVDAGRAWRSGDAGRSTVIPYLRRRGGEVALLILTHPHADHIGGAASVIEALHPPEVRDAAFVEGSALYRDLLLTASVAGTRWQRARPGERVTIDGLELEFLAPDSVWMSGLDDPNEASTVVRVRHGANRFLLTGDAESGEEGWLVDHAAGELGAEVLKVGHHGSSTSSTEGFLDAVAPRVALVSVGTANSYGHPSPEVMQRLAARGVTVLRTDQLGSIVIRSDGRSLEAEAAGHRWPLARALPESW